MQIPNRIGRVRLSSIRKVTNVKPKRRCLVCVCWNVCDVSDCVLCDVFITGENDNPHQHDRTQQPTQGSINTPITRIADIRSPITIGRIHSSRITVDLSRIENIIAFLSLTAPSQQTNKTTPTRIFTFTRAFFRFSLLLLRIPESLIFLCCVVCDFVSVVFYFASHIAVHVFVLCICCLALRVLVFFCLFGSATVP